MTLFSYNAKGELEYTVLDMDRDDVIDFAGTDRITQTARSVVTNSGVMWMQSRTDVWPTNSSTNSLLVAVNERTLDGLMSRSIVNGLTILSRTVYPGSGSRYITSTAPDGSVTIQTFSGGRALSTISKDGTAFTDGFCLRRRR